LARIAAEEARVAANEKARLAEQERARLAAEGAQKAQQAKADADAKAAEQARLSAENARQVAQQQAAEAEQKRAAAEKLAADKVPDTKATADTAVADEPAAGPPATENVHGEKAGINLASLNPSPTSPAGCRWRMERGLAALAGAVQPACRNQIRRQAGKPRCARRDQTETVAGLPAGLRAWLQTRRRPLQQDRLRGRVVPQRRQ
jgi:hypothetical protein